MIDARQLAEELENFTGTEKYYRYTPETVLTAGTKFLAEKAECFWLIDLIASFQTPAFLSRAFDLQTWSIAVHPNNSVTVICTAKGEELAREEIGKTDFVLGRTAPFKLYVARLSDGVNVAIFLPSER